MQENKELNTPLPTLWATAKRKSKELQQTSKRSKYSKRSERYDVDDIKNVVDQYLHDAPASSTPELSIYVDKVVSSVSFENFLQDISTETPPAIPIITRSYEEKFMRACISSQEEECAMKQQCECMFLDFSQPFVGTQFIFPELRENKLCIICLRKTSALLFYHTINKGVHPKGLIQMYGNICNEEGEYHPGRMLICPPSGPVHCMPHPILAHQRNLYKVVEHNGIRHAKQINVGMEDFCCALPPLVT